MSFSSPRRQNHSCDPCRRSKRRCAFLPGSGPDNSPCLNCSHLGHQCTFNDISRIVAKKKRATVEKGKQVEQHDITPTLPTVVDQVGPTTPFEPNLDPYWDIFPNNNNFYNFDLSPDDITAAWSSTPFQLQALQPQEKPAAEWDYDQGQQTANSIVLNSNLLSGYWSGSPIRLLNSSAVTKLQDRILGRLYNSMITVVASRYLSYGCNLFAGSHHYTIESEEHGDRSATALVSGHTSGDFAATQGLDTSDAASLSSFSESSSTMQDRKRVTLYGVARFLDNYGHFYGNKISDKLRKQDEDDLQAVMYAFALQHAPSNLRPTHPESRTFQHPLEHDKNNALFFTTAWFNAYSRLTRSKSNRSFLHAHTVFLFHMTTVPEDRQVVADLVDDHNEILDHALRTILDLTDLADQFCQNLKPTSTYRIYMDSCIRLMRWYGYVRDTVASLFSERKCVMENAAVEFSGSDILPCATLGQEAPYLEEDVQIPCQHIARLVFVLLRKSVTINEFLRLSPSAVDIASLIRICDSSVNAIDTFNATYGQWLEQCINRFDHLPKWSRLSALFVALFWNMGVLYLVDSMVQVTNVLKCDLSFDVYTKALEYQKTATSSTVNVAQRMKEVSAGGDLSIMEGTDTVLPFVSHHANTGMVVKALVKSIEHIIALNFGHFAGRTEPMNSYGLLVEADWICSLKPLLWCLNELNITVAGSNAAGPALRRLWKDHGDILMDCWTPD